MGFINKFFRKGLMEHVTNTGFLCYHGSEVKIDRFVDEFIGDSEATDEEGPGIYFTTDYDDAAGYGKYVYTVKLRGNFLVSSNDPNQVDRDKMVELAKMAEDWEMEAQNYNEDPELGVQSLVDGAFEYNEDEKGVLQEIWYALYRYRGLNFVKNCVKIGIDGLVVNRYRNKENEGKHVIIYNPNVITLTDVEKLE